MADIPQSPKGSGSLARRAEVFVRFVPNNGATMRLASGIIDCAFRNCESQLRPFIAGHLVVDVFARVETLNSVTLESITPDSFQQRHVSKYLEVFQNE
jgi:hypothetical protein